MSSFFGRLFEHKDKQIEWAMHTAYSCDIGYAQVLLGMQYDVNPDSAEKYVSNNRTAFFYNKTKKSPGLVGNRMGKTATVNMNKILFSVSGEVQTFHAKISLVCFSNEEGEKSYRMAVYSKNLTYNDSCAEISLLFNLDTNREGKVEKQNGFQLESYLKKLRDACSDDQGKEWINRNILNDYALEKFALISEFQEKEGKLYFGGVTDITLAKQMNINQVICKNSLVLTPPEFLRETNAEKYFINSKILYDFNPSPNGEQLRLNSDIEIKSSHIKLYLLNYENEYSVWLGSANASVQGIGWNFEPNNTKFIEKSECSVECLVRFDLTENEFYALKAQIEKFYSVFDYSDGQTGSLNIIPDQFGPWAVTHCQVKGVYPEKKEKVIKYELEVDWNDFPAKLNAKDRNWLPAEYVGQSKSNNFEDKSKEHSHSITITFQIGSNYCFRNCQGYLLFGKSRCVLPIPLEVLENSQITLMADSKSDRKPDNRLSLIMKSRNLQDAKKYVDEKLDSDAEILKYFNVLVHEKNNLFGVHANNIQKEETSIIITEKLPVCVQIKESPMTFQKKSAECIFNMWKNRSRVFLADEAGLGKTYSAAAAICLQAQETWTSNVGLKTFLVLYIAPNKTVLSKCVNDFIKKAEGQLNYEEHIERIDGERLTEIVPKLEINKYEEKTILILAVSESCLLGDAIAKEEKDAIKNSIDGKTLKTRAEYTTWFLKKYKPGVIIWDEYHRYHKKLTGEKSNVLLNWEKESHTNENIDIPFKSLFLSATPYTTNISGKENKEVLEKLYNIKSDDGIDELAQLPAFEEFATLFCGGWQNTKLTCDSLKELKELYDKYTGKLNDDKKENPEKDLQRLLKELYDKYTGNPNADTKEMLEKALQMGMIRHERTQLQMELEEHVRRTKVDSLLQQEYTLPLRNSYNQVKKLLDSGFSECVTGWSLSLPWILSFAAKPGPMRRKITGGRWEGEITKIIHRDNQFEGAISAKLIGVNTTIEGTIKGPIGDNLTKCSIIGRLNSDGEGETSDEFEIDENLPNKSTLDSFFELLNPVEKKLDEELFGYKENNQGEAEPINELTKMSEKNLAFHEICKIQLEIDNGISTMAQLLWMPPTIPLYKPDDGSVFQKHSDYSKMVIFAEYRTLQRGVALLLSDYAKELNNRSCPPDFENLLKNMCSQLKDEIWSEISNFKLTEHDYRKQSLNAVLEDIKKKNDWEEETALVAIAHPAQIAIKLDIAKDKDEATEIAEAFFTYLSQDGVKEALWAWLFDNGFSKKGKWEYGILRYCAEGNLYAVMEEWKTLYKPEENKSVKECFIEILSPKFFKERNDTKISSRGTIVNVQTYKTTTFCPTPLLGYDRKCSFADRLTGDVTDVGTGDDEENSRLLMRQFTSPFWPMVMVCGRGAQEGLDFHQYCSRIMHLTLPRGAVSYEQRRGRIDRYRSLLVRRRAVELLSDVELEDNDVSNMLNRIFDYLAKHPELHHAYDTDKKLLNDQLYPNWHIPVKGSKYNFEEIIPVWPYTDESIFLEQLDAMLESYRRPMGSGYDKVSEDTILDLSAKS